MLFWQWLVFVLRLDTLLNLVWILSRKAVTLCALCVIMGVLGVVLNVWIGGSFTPEILLGGLASGLASTGAYETVKNIKGKEK